MIRFDWVICAITSLCADVSNSVATKAPSAVYLMNRLKSSVVLRMIRAARDSSCWQRWRVNPSSMWPSECRHAWWDVQMDSRNKREMLKVCRIWLFRYKFLHHRLFGCVCTDDTSHYRTHNSIISAAVAKGECLQHCEGAMTNSINLLLKKINITLMNSMFLCALHPVTIKPCDTTHSSLERSEAGRFDIRRLVGEPQTRGHMHDEAEWVPVFNLCHPHALNVSLGALLQLLLHRGRATWNANGHRKWRESAVCGPTHHKKGWLMTFIIWHNSSFKSTF